MIENRSMQVVIGVFWVGQGKGFRFYVNRIPLASVDIHGYRDPYFPAVHVEILLLCCRGMR